MNLGFYSYLSAVLGFCFLGLLLLFSWRSSLQGRLLTVVVVTTAVWAAIAAVVAGDYAEIAGFYLAFEILRYIAWYVFLLKLFEPAVQQMDGYRFLRRRGLLLCTGFAGLLLVFEAGTTHLATAELAQALMPWRYTGHILLSLIGLAIIEQLFRNIAPDYRYNLKFLFIGAGAIFAYDFFLYANALLFSIIDIELWAARGLVNLITVPLLAITASRNRGWSPNIFVSRDIVLHTTTFVAGGLYLLAMAAVGYYLQQYGGSWGRVAQVSFFSLAIILLITVLFSGQLRRQLRVFLVKHFYRNKYDYRLEWLNLTAALNNKVRDTVSLDAAIQVLAEIVDARAGLLWLDDGRGQYRNIAAWHMPPVGGVIPKEDVLVRFIASNAYVVNLPEVKTHPEEYGQLACPEWVKSIDGAWLAVPLPGIDRMPGFIILAQPRAVFEVDWEDRDLLKTAARQVASHVTVLMTSDALAQARQFEVFNRLSAFMVHDLKNIAAELEMVAKNAARHKANPEFIEDAFDTVTSASGDIGRLLDQLRDKRVELEKKVVIELGSLVEEIVGKKKDRAPVPVLDGNSGACRVLAEKAQLANVLTHLIDNAQQATAADGSIRIRIYPEGGNCVIEICDSGHGMAADFIQNRLFAPFDTTKGNAGMGIGMYESREFVHRLGGEIRVESEPGKGTIIALCIPAATG